eukprot:TRINITY_DN20083_c0_g1_i2.p1 TRINITY_DN20083_c0_g1~~TRINITY_DN20083_c0_g1_i2.p1  ORF type:complete len:361 (+),score=73.36 TRINITY_DN20083_c0_g1_i2:97-1179(+)
MEKPRQSKMLAAAAAAAAAYSLAGLARNEASSSPSSTFLAVSNRVKNTRKSRVQDDVGDEQFPSRVPSDSQHQTSEAAAAVAAAALGVVATGAAGRSRRRKALNDNPCNRREALFGAALCMTTGAAASTAGPQQCRAYELESNRLAEFRKRAREMNSAADWYLFDVAPLVYPDKDLISRGDCDGGAIGTCPELANCETVLRMYTTVGGQPGKLERDVFYPMKDLALSPITDPDTAEDLQEIFQKFQISQVKVSRAAENFQVADLRAAWNEGKDLFNQYFTKVNNAMGIEPSQANYMAPLPDLQALATERYWIRRGEKYAVKKKVDAVSKANKTARFYAKSIFGEDAVSWDSRGDRADEDE